MRFLRPDYGWWLLGGLVLLIVIRWRGTRSHAASTTVNWLDRRSRASPLRRLPFVPLATALVLAGLGLMEPVLPFAESDLKSRGLDIVMVLDLSSSMLEPIGIQAKQGPLVSIVERPGARVTRRPPVKTRLDATKDAIKAGTQVTVNGFLARAGGTVGNAYQVRLPDGKELFAASSVKIGADAK